MTQHTHVLVFGRREADCPRCAELDAGAPPVRWSTRKRDADAQRRREIAAHDCQQAGCGPVCTHGDW